MKRKLLICSSLITLLLSVFSVPIFAEETVQDSSTIHTLSDGVFLDSYFYDNYDLLPYIQSTGSEYLNTGYNASSSLRIDVTLSDIRQKNNQEYNNLFGARDNSGVNSLSAAARFNPQQPNGYYLTFDVSNYNFSTLFVDYQMIHLLYDQNKFYVNEVLKREFSSSEFESDYPIYVFTLNTHGSLDNHSIYKLYKFSIYDYSLNDGEGEFVRYYYPAKSKSSGTIGLYDAVNKTFISSISASNFINPTNDYVENFQISSFLSASLGWIGQIFTAIIDMPIIIVFMAIGLAGAMFRWGRRIVHF